MKKQLLIISLFAASPSFGMLPFGINRKTPLPPTVVSSPPEKGYVEVIYSNLFNKKICGVVIDEDEITEATQSLINALIKCRRSPFSSCIDKEMDEKGFHPVTIVAYNYFCDISTDERVTGGKARYKIPSQCNEFINAFIKAKKYEKNHKITFASIIEYLKEETDKN